MYFDRRSAVHETLTRLARTLDELGVDYAIAGAMAMFLHGFRRFTEDVDVIVTREGLEEFTRRWMAAATFGHLRRARIFATRILA